VYGVWVCRFFVRFGFIFSIKTGDFMTDDSGVERYLYEGYKSPKSFKRKAPIAPLVVNYANAAISRSLFLIGSYSGYDICLEPLAHSRSGVVAE
jgi:hypothetical protein